MLGSLTLVCLALLLELAGRFHGGFAPVLVEVLVAHDLTADELVLEVGAGSHATDGQQRSLTRDAKRERTG